MVECGTNSEGEKVNEIRNRDEIARYNYIVWEYLERNVREFCENEVNRDYWINLFAVTLDEREIFIRSFYDYRILKIN